MSEKLSGLPASSGIAIGPAWIYRPIQVTIERQVVQDVAAEIARFRQALVEAEEELQSLVKETLAKSGPEEAAIFEAHQMLLGDPDLIEAVEEMISVESINAEASVHESIESYALELEELEDEYFRARAVDLRDVGRRLVYCLMGVRSGSVQLPVEPVVVFAEDLTPSDTVQFDRNMILGIATIRGGPTSHTAILARSMAIPAAVSIPLDLNQITEGETVVLDGGTGSVTIGLDPDELVQARQDQDAWQVKQAIDLEASEHPAFTRDGHQVEVVANIGNAADAEQALTFGAEGVGLFRTEFLFLERNTMPSEDEQMIAYRRVFEVMGDRPVVVRTLDIGGDKAVPYLGFAAEANPFLGWRAIRISSERPEVLQTQFRALLRAAVGADLRIMVPMVARLREVEETAERLKTVREALIHEGLPSADRVQFGIMIEVPSAALVAEHIAPAVDFFSIGTNDLTQYTLAVDRTNERVASIASPFHPAVLRLIQMTIDAAHSHGKWVGLCGEFAGDPLATPLLLGLGLDEFSMAPVSIPTVKALIRRLSLATCRSIAAHVMSLPSAQDVRAYLESVVDG